MYQKLFKKVKKVRTKITLSVIITVFVMALSVAVFGTMVTRYSTVDALEKTLCETAELAAVSVQKSVDIHKNVLSFIAGEDTLTGRTASWQAKRAFMQSKCAELGYLDYYLFDANGKDPLGTADVSQMDYFTYPQRGETYISPAYPKENGEGMYHIISAPVLENGKLVAVIGFAADQLFLQEIVESILVGESENGDVYVLDGEGTTLASLEYDLVLAQENLAAAPVESLGPADLDLREIEVCMVAGQTGLGEWTDEEGIDYLQAYTPIADTHGWSIAVTIDMGEFLHASSVASYLLIGIIAVVMGLCCLFAMYIGSSIAAPVSTCSERLTRLAAGDLHSPVSEIPGCDEVALLAASTAELTQSFRQIVDEVDATLSRIADGDLTGDIGTVQYPGDFASLKQNLVVIGERLNQTVGDISRASNYVYSGAQQVSDGAQVVAQGAAEQANSVDELSSSVAEISARVKRTAENAAVARETSADAESQLLECSRQMEELVSAMNDISEKSEQIGKIIKAIEDISFQTNILALNAAVEAARAGSAGKGFAVVADEVRNLAAKSAEASQNTSSLIESAISSVQAGMKTLDRTAGALSEVVDSSRRSAQLVGEISGNANEQAASIGQITAEIEKIVAVVGMSTSTSEESAATSAALSEQAQLLKKSVDQFRLRENG